MTDTNSFPSSFFFANAKPGEPLSYQALQTRRKIAEAIAGQRRSAFPKTLGEGLTYAGEKFGDALDLRSLDEQEQQAAAYERARSKELFGEGGTTPPPGTPAAPSAAATTVAAPPSGVEPAEPYANPPITTAGIIPMPRPRPQEVAGMPMPGPPPPLPSYLNTFGPASWPSQKLVEVPTDPGIDPNVWPPGPRAPGMRVAGPLPAPDTGAPPAPPIGAGGGQLPALSAIAGTMPSMGSSALPDPLAIQRAPEPLQTGALPAPPAAGASVLGPALGQGGAIEKAPPIGMPPSQEQIPPAAAPYLTEVRPAQPRPKPLPISQEENKWKAVLANPFLNPQGALAQRAQQQYEYEKAKRLELERQAQSEWEHDRGLREGELKLREVRKFDDPERARKDLQDRIDIEDKQYKAAQRPLEREQALANLEKTRTELRQLEQTMRTSETHTQEGELYERAKGGGVGAPVTKVPGFQEGQKLTESEAKTLGFFQRAHVASQQIGNDKALAGIQDVTKGRVLPYAEYVQTPEYQKAKNSAMAWIYAILRRESGALISPDEENKYLRIFFPVPGNTPEVMADKADLRRTTERSLYDALGDRKHVADKFVADRQAEMNASALQWLKDNPNDPRAPAMRQKLGL